MVKPYLETKIGSVGTLSGSHESDSTVETKSGKPKLEKVGAQKIDVLEDVFETKEVGGATRVARNLTGPNLQARHFEAEIKPKNAGHLQFLQGCSSFEGTVNSGKVQANIDANFWPWLSKLDPNFIKQAYLDAAVVRGEKSTMAADSVGLIAEAGIGAEMDANAIEALERYRKNAHQALEQVYLKKSGRKLVIHSNRSKKEYEKLTEGSLSFDYPVYRRSQRFCNQILEASRKSGHVQSADAVKKIMKKDGHKGQTVVIAIDRLQRLFEQQKAEAALVDEDSRSDSISL